MDTLTAIFTRHSTRAFGAKRVSDADLRRVLAAGMSAPIGRSRYDTLHLSVIRNAALIEDLQTYAKSVLPPQSRPDAPLYNCNTLILVSSAMQSDAPAIEYANVGAVMTNMAIASTALGIDSIWLWGFLRVLSPELIARLGLPAGHIPISALGIGYAADSQGVAATEFSKPRHAIDVTYLD